MGRDIGPLHCGTEDVNHALAVALRMDSHFSVFNCRKQVVMALHSKAPARGDGVNQHSYDGLPRVVERQSLSDELAKLSVHLF